MRSLGTRIQRSVLDFLIIPFVDRLVDLHHERDTSSMTKDPARKVWKVNHTNSSRTISSYALYSIPSR
jgi:hypothetical protein